MSDVTPYDQDDPAEATDWPEPSPDPEAEPSHDSAGDGPDDGA